MSTEPQGEKRPLPKLSFSELPKPPSLPPAGGDHAGANLPNSGSNTSLSSYSSSPSASAILQSNSNHGAASAHSANAAASPVLGSTAGFQPASSATTKTGGAAVGASGVKTRGMSVRRIDSNQFLSRESVTDLSRLRQIQRPTRTSPTPALQRQHAFIAVTFAPVLGSKCGHCNLEVTPERQYFMCQRCTLTLHADCVDKKGTGTCENFAELTSFEIIDVEIAEALQDKVNKINQINALIADSLVAQEAAQKKAEAHAETPKLLAEELKLHEKKLKKFRHEKGQLESLIFVEVSDMSEEMRRYSMIDEQEDDSTGKDSSMGSFAKGIKDKMKLALS